MDVHIIVQALPFLATILFYAPLYFHFAKFESMPVIVWLYSVGYLFTIKKCTGNFKPANMADKT